MVETIGEAFSLGWSVTARCACGSREGMKSIRQCNARYDLDLETPIASATRRPFASWDLFEP
jgi:hypothetical protein